MKLRRIALGCAVSGLLVVLSCYAISTLLVHWHDHRLEMFAETVYHYPLPPETVVSHRQAVQDKVGNGNNCWYRVRQTMYTTLSKEDVVAYYADVQLPVPAPGLSMAYDNLPRQSPVWVRFSSSRDAMPGLWFTVELSADTGETSDPRCH